MGDNGGTNLGMIRVFDDEMVPKSPWKTSATASPVTGTDSESWPALSGAQQRPKLTGSVDSNAAKSPPPPTLMKTVVCGDPPSPAPPQVTAEQSKFQGRGNFKSRRANTSNQNRQIPKQGLNSIPPFAVSPPHFNHDFPNMSPYSSTFATGYAFQSTPRPFPRADTQPVKSGSTNETYNQKSPYWHNQQPVSSHNFHLQQTMDQRPLMRCSMYRPRLFGVPLPGPPPPCYLPAHPGYARFTYPCLSYPFGPGVPPGPGVSPPPPPPLPTITLKDKIINQIEYYFSDVNLRTDDYLKTLMDHQGWVPISLIANFNRVKQMNVGIPFILEALLVSKTIEVQGDKIRRRSKWIPPSLISESVPRMKINNNENENKVDGTKGTTELPPSRTSSINNGVGHWRLYSITGDNISELELEHKTIRNDLPSTVGSIDGEDDEIFDKDQIVERLVTSTQNISPFSD